MSKHQALYMMDRKREARVLLVFHAGRAQGLGHMMRMRRLRLALEDCSGIESSLLIFGEQPGLERAGQIAAEIAAEIVPGEADVARTLHEVLTNAELPFDAIVLDLSRHHTGRDLGRLLSTLRSRRIKLIAVDHIGDAARFLDLHWVPSFRLPTRDQDLGVDPPPDGPPAPSTEFGWDCYFVDQILDPQPWGPGARVLILTGGSDIAQFSSNWPKMLDERLPAQTEITWVQGPFSQPPQLPAAPRLAWRIPKAPAGLSRFMKGTQYALTVYGVSFCELMSFGIPTVLCSPYGAQDSTDLAAIDRMGLAAVAASVQDAVEQLALLMADHNRARLLHDRTTALGVGGGASRLAARIQELVRRRA